MKRSFKIIFLVSFIIVSCSSDSDEYLYNRLQSDWIYVQDPAEFLRFKDSLVATEHTDIFRSYFFDNDTLFIENTQPGSYYDRRGMDFYFKYFIDSISANYIWHMGSNDKFIPIYYSTDKYYYDNIILNSIEIRFVERYRGLRHWSLYIDKNLHSYLKIDGYRKIRKEFLLLPYSEGNYFAHITPEEFEYIQNKVQRIPYSELKKEYFYDRIQPDNNYVHYQLKISIGIKDNPGIKNIVVNSYGHEGLPGPLGVLINYLKQIHFFSSTKELISCMNLNLNNILSL